MYMYNRAYMYMYNREYYMYMYNREYYMYMYNRAYMYMYNRAYMYMYIQLVGTNCKNNAIQRSIGYQYRTIDKASLIKP